MSKKIFTVTGMTCASCSARVEKAVSKLAGVNQAAVNLLTNSMEVNYDETQLTSENIIKAVEDAGYGASVKNSKKQMPKVMQQVLKMK